VKLGTENRNKMIAAGALSVLALVLIGRIFFASSDSTPPPSAVVVPVTPVRPAKGKTARNTGKNLPAAAPHSLDPELRYDWLRASEDTKYEGNGRNIFKAQAEIPQPVAPVDTAEDETEKGPPPPPPPPPITLKFFGFANKPGEPKKIFLSQGEDVFIAAEGEIVDRHYKVVRISPMSVEIEDVLNNNRQSIPLTQG
jgi:hypothetical protein